MIVLLACGMSLAESYAAHRGQATLGQLDERLLFIAEAGLWHAAQAESSLPNPVSFGGGTYTVTKNGDDYTSTAVLGDNVRVVSEEIVGPGEPPPTSPLDEEASEATIRSEFRNTFEIDLISVAPGGVVITDFTLIPLNGFHLLPAIQIDGNLVWLFFSGVWLPIVNQPFGGIFPDNWTIQAGETRTFRAIFWTLQNQPSTFQLQLNFSNGGSSSFEFTAPW